MNLKKIVFFAFALLWPYNLYRANTLANFTAYLIPPALLSFSFLLYKKGRGDFLLPTIFIPLFFHKLLPVPILTSIIFFLIRRNRRYLIYLLGSLAISFFIFKSFWGQTIFIPDYQARQTVIRNTYLYPNVLLARAFQNKVKIIADKFAFNLTALVDPTNYFFGFHPREIVVDNQNLYKFSFLSFPFFILGIYYLRKNKNFNFIFSVLASCLISLALLTNFDRNDFILALPLLLILDHGLNLFSQRL